MDGTETQQPGKMASFALGFDEESVWRRAETPETDANYSCSKYLSGDIVVLFKTRSKKKVDLCICTDLDCFSLT